MNLSSLFKDACARYIISAVGVYIGLKFSLFCQGKGVFDFTMVSLETMISFTVGAIAGFMLVKYLDMY